MLKSTSMKALCALVISAFMHLSSAAAATFFPALADGDVFTGLMYLNPTTPLSSYTTDTAYIYVSPPAFGFVTVNIPGGTFLGSADLVEAMPGSGDQWRWFMQAQSGTFNGVALPLSIISLILYGSTASTSILPDLPSYTLGTPSDTLIYSSS